MKALLLRSEHYKVPKDLILLDDICDAKAIEKLARNILKETLHKSDIEELDFQYDDDESVDNTTAYMLCYLQYGKPFRKITLEVKELRRAAEILHLQVVELQNTKYLLCDVPSDAARYEWDITHSDSYPHKERNSLKYVTPKGYTETAFHSLDLPKGVNIENLQILGLQSELRKKTNITSNIFKTDVLGVFSEDEDTLERYLHLNDVPATRDVMWLTINSKNWYDR